jgi:hypothetical protein
MYGSLNQYTSPGRIVSSGYALKIESSIPGPLPEMWQATMRPLVSNTPTK